MQNRHRLPIPHPARGPSLVCALVLAALAAFPAGVKAQVATQFSVVDVDPDGALPGDPVILFGTGFGQSPEALFCWVDTGNGGFPFVVADAADARIDAVLGEVPSAATGTVKVWKGERYRLADRVVLSQGRLFSAADGEVFVGSAAAAGPAFSSFGASPDTLGSVTVRGELRLDLRDLDPYDPGGDAGRVRVTAVIETGDDSGNSTPPEGALAPLADTVTLSTGIDGGDPSWAAVLTIGTDAPPPTAGALAAGLAEVLETQLGSAGLTARAEGTELVVGHALGIRAGFLDLTFE